MGAGLILLLWCHGFHILKLKHPLLQNIHTQWGTNYNQITATPREKRIQSSSENSFRRDALGEEELLERQRHELAVHEKVEGLRLVVRFGC